MEWGIPGRDRKNAPPQSGNKGEEKGVERVRASQLKSLHASPMICKIAVAEANLLGVIAYDL